MLRKLLLSAVLATGALTGLAVTADAHPPAHRPNHVRFEVLYRQHDHWDCYGTFGDRDDARRVARQLRHRGYVVRVEQRGR